MKKLELKQMENLVGGQKQRLMQADNDGGAKYCTKETTGMLLAVGGLAFAAATGGLGAIALAGFSFYLSVDSVASGSCSSW